VGAMDEVERCAGLTETWGYPRPHWRRLEAVQSRTTTASSAAGRDGWRGRAPWHWADMAHPQLGPTRAKAGCSGLAACVQRGGDPSRSRGGSWRRGYGKRAWSMAGACEQQSKGEAKGGRVSE
jgi:hypothetical protein